MVVLAFRIVVGALAKSALTWAALITLARPTWVLVVLSFRIEIPSPVTPVITPVEALIAIDELAIVVLLPVPIPVRLPPDIAILLFRILFVPSIGSVPALSLPKRVLLVESSTS